MGDNKGDTELDCNDIWSTDSITFSSQRIMIDDTELFLAENDDVDVLLLKKNTSTESEDWELSCNIYGMKL